MCTLVECPPAHVEVAVSGAQAAAEDEHFRVRPFCAPFGGSRHSHQRPHARHSRKRQRRRQCVDSAECSVVARTGGRPGGREDAQPN
eukprot:gene23456-biopygen10344